MSKYDVTDIKKLFFLLPWHELWVIFHPKRSNRGLKPKFTWEMLLKAMIIQWKVDIPDDTHFADWLKKAPEAVEACGMPHAPSHDVLSRFTREHGHNFKKLHAWLDEMLEQHGVFVDDDIAGDGTNVPLHQPQAKPDDMCFGAKSNDEKFYGLWLMLLVSVRTGLVRSFNYDKARIGQIPLMFELLINRIIQTGVMIFLDGIFDVKDIHAAVWFDQESTPMITYNKKNSKYETRKDLPYDDWRGDYNPDFKDGLWMIIEQQKRTSVERTNGFLKENTPLKQVYERSRRLQKRSQKHINKLIVGAVVLPQIEKLIEIYTPKPITLLNFINQEKKQEVTA